MVVMFIFLASGPALLVLASIWVVTSMGLGSQLLGLEACLQEQAWGCSMAVEFADLGQSPSQ